MGLEKLADDADKLAGLLTSLLITALAVLGLLAVLALAYQVARLRFRRQLVVENLVNASGLQDLDGKLAGLSQLMRERFVDQMGRLASKVQESIAAADLKSYSAVVDKAPLPQNAPDQRLTELMNSLTTFASDKAGPALQLVNTVLLRPRGTKVSTTLQRQGDTPGRLGVTFQIADLKGSDVPTPVTISEAESDRPASVRPEAAALSDIVVDPVAASPVSNPEVGGRLATVGLLGEAVKYLERALKLDPSGRQFPTGTNGETIAHLRLGAQYEAVGALEEAKSEYIEALKAGAENETAIEALGKVLRQERSVEARYLELLKPTVRRLVVELAKRELVNLPWLVLVRRVQLSQILIPGLPTAIKAQRCHDRALVCNYIGSLYVTSTATFPKFLRYFEELATQEFEEALRLDDQLYQAHEYLAYVYGWPKQQEITMEETRSRRERALLHFDKALALVESGRRVPKEEERQAVTRLLTVGRAMITVELADSDEAIKDAKRRVEDVFSGWKETCEQHHRVLYNLAAWYGILLQNRQASEGDLERAKRLLAYAMARTPIVAPSKASMDGYWRDAASDSDLRCVTSANALSRLRLAIDRKHITCQQLPFLKGTEFEQIMHEVMDDADWLGSRKGGQPSDLLRGRHGEGRGDAAPGPRGPA